MAVKAPWKIKRLKEQRVKNLGKYTQKGFFTKEKHPTWKGGDVTKNCPFCKKEFLCKHAEKDTRKYCSRTCSNKGRIPPNLGKKFSEEHRKNISIGKQGVSKENWEGFSRTQDQRGRVEFRRIIQKKVFERDNYTCQLCGKRGNQLQVDHILSWKDYPELRFDMDNCRTLCQACHYLITYKKEMPKEIKTWGHNLTNFRGGALP